MINHVNINQKKAGVAVLRMHKDNLRTRNITRDKEAISSRRHNNPKHTDLTKLQNNRTERELDKSTSWKLQHSSLNI